MSVTGFLLTSFFFGEHVFSLVTVNAASLLKLSAQFFDFKKIYLVFY